MHYLGDDAVEGGSLVVQWHSARSLALLSSAQSPEVLDGLGHRVTKETHHDAT